MPPGNLRRIVEAMIFISVLTLVCFGCVLAKAKSALKYQKKKGLDRYTIRRLGISVCSSHGPRSVSSTTDNQEKSSPYCGERHPSSELFPKYHSRFQNKHPSRLQEAGIHQRPSSFPRSPSLGFPIVIGSFQTSTQPHNQVSVSVQEGIELG